MDALMAAALPYHATNQFVRVVQVTRIEHTIWAFLRPMQKSGAALPRSNLVQRSLNDQVRNRSGSKALCLHSHRMRHGTYHRLGSIDT